MADNLTGIGQTTEKHRTDWSPAGNGGTSEGETRRCAGALGAKSGNRAV